MGGNNATLLEDIKTTKGKLNISAETIFTAHSSFANHFNTFMSLAENLADKIKELEMRENVVETREREVKEKEQLVVEREKRCAEREQEIAARDKEVSTKEERWIEIEKRMQQNADKLPTIIQFNISGTRFAAPKEMLLRHKGSLFEQMLTTNHPQVLTASNEIFIARDPKYFQHVIRFMVSGIVSPKLQERPAIEQEFAFYGIPCKFSTPIFLPRTSVRSEEFITKFGNKIQEWLPNKRFQLLYKASVDGFGAAEFHKWCDNKGPTLTIIQANNGALFGGYTPLSWDSSTNNYKAHSDGFIFTLTNPHDIPPTKYPIIDLQKSTQSIWTGGAYGPIFGAGHDICLHNNSNQPSNPVSYTGFPATYVDSTGKGNNTFTGARHFVSSEIEVFSVLLL